MTIEPIVVRALAGPDELDLFLQLSYVLDDELVEDLERGRRRPEWMWVALRGAHLVARLAWWTATDGGPPLFLDLFDLDDTLDDADRIDIGLKLLNAATAEVLPAGVPRPEYGRFTPPDWREDPVARRMVEGRIRVMEKTGARLLVDRLRLEWLPGTPIPEPTMGLRFRPALDRDELVELMTLVLENTLDAHSQRDLATMTPAQAAAWQYDDEFLGYRSPRAWWKIAELANGTPVGFVIPVRNSYHPIIAYIGCYPPTAGMVSWTRSWLRARVSSQRTRPRGFAHPRISATCRWRWPSRGRATSPSNGRST